MLVVGSVHLIGGDFCYSPNSQRDFQLPLVYNDILFRNCFKDSTSISLTTLVATSLPRLSTWSPLFHNLKLICTPYLLSRLPPPESYYCKSISISVCRSFNEPPSHFLLPSHHKDPLYWIQRVSVASLLLPFTLLSDRLSSASNSLTHLNLNQSWVTLVGFISSSPC